MLTPDRIDEIRQHTGVSAIEAMHALMIAEGNVQRAIGDLNDHARSGNRAITASTREARSALLPPWSTPASGSNANLRRRRSGVSASLSAPIRNCSL